jgi:membrane protein YqaA with SNARE-associated domain/molybdopterin converting factor small subunit
MAVVFIPSLLRKLTGGASEMRVAGATVREVVDALEASHPGIKARLVADDRLRPNIALVVDGVNSREGLRHALSDEAEVHFVPAMAGGSDRPVMPESLEQPKQPQTPLYPQYEHLTPRERLRMSLPLIAALVLTVIAAGLGFYYRDWLFSLGRYGLIGVFVINLVNNATVILPAPFGFIATCIFANPDNWVSIGIAAGLGSGLGEYTAYMAGSGGNAVIPHGRIYALMQEYMRRFGAALVFVLSAIPNPLFDVGGLIAGMLKMPPSKFLIATILGKLIRYVVVAYACEGGLPWLRGLFPA